MDILPSVLLEGLLLGSVYAMIALGYSMVYGVLRLINFAHSEVFMIGAVTGVEIFRCFGSGAVNSYALLAAAMGAGGLVSAAVAGAMERLAYRPLRRRGSNRLVPLITAIGVSFFLQDAVRLIEGLWHNEFYMSYPSRPELERTITLPGPMEIQVKSLIVLGVTAAMMTALMLLVSRTRMGKAIRAVAEDPQTAALMGINPDRVISQTFLIGGFLGGVAGVLFGVLFTQVNPFVGFVPGIKAFTAAVLGGIGSIPGAVVGGLLLGGIETLGATFLPLLTEGAIGSEYAEFGTFLVLILCLLLRPAGLFGKTQIDKV